MFESSILKSLSPPQKYRLSVNNFQRMVQAGIFNEDEHIELIEGELIIVPPIGSKHADCVSYLARKLIQQTDAAVRIQDPIQLSPHSEPEPDLAIVKNARYIEQHPGSQEVLLLIEVADTSLAYDREVKIPLYAKHAIPEVWLINLRDERLEIYTQPTPTGYRQCLRPLNEEVISPGQLPEIQIVIRELWG